MHPITYTLLLKEIGEGPQTFFYELKDDFFCSEGEDIHQGKISVELLVVKTEEEIELLFQWDGWIVIPCDRCMSDMKYPILFSSQVKITSGEKETKENDERLKIAKDGSLCLKRFLYESVVLSIPIQHVHVAGECDQAMLETLKKYIVQ